MSLGLAFSWLDAPEVRGPDRHAWADLAVQIDGRDLDVVDVGAGLVRRHFATSLLPLVEWMIAAWPRLTEERNWPTHAGAARSWHHSHNLVAGRGGGPMPSVSLQRIDDRTFRVRTHDDRPQPPGISVRFGDAPEGTAESGSVVRELGRVINAVLARLDAHDRWLHDELSLRWKEAQSARALTAGRLGIADLRELSVDELTQLDELSTDARLLALAEAHSGSDIVARRGEALRLVQYLPGTDALAPVSSAWRGLRLPRGEGAPWLVGWRAAAELRTSLGLAANDPPAARLSSLLERAVDWPEAAQTRPLPVHSRGIDLVVVTAPGHMPCALAAADDDRAGRFRLAKSVFLALASGADAAGVVVDTARAARHSEANAFAAELLAPAAFLATLTPADGIWEREDIERAARACATGRRIIAHQIQNRDLGELAA